MRKNPEDQVQLDVTVSQACALWHLTNISKKTRELIDSEKADHEYTWKAVKYVDYELWVDIDKQLNALSINPNTAYRKTGIYVVVDGERMSVSLAQRKGHI